MCDTVKTILYGYTYDTNIIFKCKKSLTGFSIPAGFQIYFNAYLKNKLFEVKNIEVLALLRIAVLNSYNFVNFI